MAVSPAGGVALSPTLTISHSYTASGVYTVSLTAWNTCTLAPLTATMRDGGGSPCLPLTGLSLTYTPTQVYTYTAVAFRAEVLTGSLPVTYTWALGDASPPISGHDGRAGLDGDAHLHPTRRLHVHPRGLERLHTHADAAGGDPDRRAVRGYLGGCDYLATARAACRGGDHLLPPR